MNLSTTAAAIVLRTSHSQSHVFLTTQPLALDSGRCHHFLALQTAVALMVSGEEKLDRVNWADSAFCLLKLVSLGLIMILFY